MIVALALSAVAFGASAAQLITKEEVKHFKLAKVGPSRGPSGGEFSSPSDLHDQLSKLADEKGGKYYVITAARSMVTSKPQRKCINNLFKSVP